MGSVPSIVRWHRDGKWFGRAGSGRTAEIWNGGVVPLQEEEVIQTIRLLTHFGQAMQDPNSSDENLKVELGKIAEGTKVNLAQLLEGLASQTIKNDGEASNDTPLLMKAAESMAIKFALDRYQKGDIKVNAVHEMMEHLSRQMDTLRQILRVQEDKMSKAGILVESHADILDRMFWAEIPESGKKSVLLSSEAACVPPRNIRQFVEVLLEREDDELAGKILSNYCGCLDAKEPDPRRKAAAGLAQLADLYANAPVDIMPRAITMMSEKIAGESDSEIQSLLSASFARFGQEAASRKKYKAIAELCSAFDRVAQDRPNLAQDLRSRVGVENRLPEMIEEAINSDLIPQDLVQVLQQLPKNAVEHLADRFFRSQKREECDRIIDLVGELGQPAVADLREILRLGQPRQAAATVGLLSRLDAVYSARIAARPHERIQSLLSGRSGAPDRLRAAPDRGRTLLELLELLDPLVLPETIDEIGMSQDRSASASLIALAASGEAQSRSPFVQLKAIESLGRLREAEAVPSFAQPCRRKENVWIHPAPRTAHRRDSGALQDRSAYGTQASPKAALRPRKSPVAPLDSAPGCPWVRQRRYERIILPAHAFGDSLQFLGKVEHRHARDEPGRRHGHAQRQSARRLGSKRRDLCWVSRKSADRFFCAAPASTKSASSSSEWISTAATACAACWSRRSKKLPKTALRIGMARRKS